MIFAKNKDINIFTIFEVCIFANASPITKGGIWKGKNKFEKAETSIIKISFRLKPLNILISWAIGVKTAGIVACVNNKPEKEIVIFKTR